MVSTWFPVFQAPLLHFSVMNHNRVILLCFLYLFFIRNVYFCDNFHFLKYILCGSWSVLFHCILKSDSWNIIMLILDGLFRVIPKNIGFAYMYEKYWTRLRLVQYLIHTCRLIQYFQVLHSSHPILYHTPLYWAIIFDKNHFNLIYGQMLE